MLKTSISQKTFLGYPPSSVLEHVEEATEGKPANTSSPV